MDRVSFAAIQNHILEYIVRILQSAFLLMGGLLVLAQAPAAAQSQLVPAAPLEAEPVWLAVANDRNGADENVEYSGFDDVCRAHMAVDAEVYGGSGEYIGVEFQAYAEPGDVPAFFPEAIAFSLLCVGSNTGSYFAYPQCGDIDGQGGPYSIDISTGLCRRAGETSECNACEPGSSPLSSPPQPIVGGAVSVESGVVTKQESDFAADDGLLGIKRDYRSRQRGGGDGNGGRVSEIPGFGHNWHGALPGRLTIYGDDARNIEFLSDKGSIKKFTSVGAAPDDPDAFQFGSDDFTALRLSMAVTPTSDRATYFQQDIPNGQNANPSEVRLDFANGDYILFRRSGSYDANNKMRYLVPIEQGMANGYKRWFDYPDSDQFPNKIRDSLNRETSLQWTNSELVGELSFGGVAEERMISRIDLPDGTRLQYQYGAAKLGAWPARSNRLETVQRISGTGTVLWARSYLYEKATQQLALTGVLDQNGQRLATYEYDDGGRAISSQMAGAVGPTTVEYLEDPNDTTSYVRKVTNPLGRETYYYFSRDSADDRNSPRLLKRVESLATADAPAQVMTFNYDANSLLATVTDANGNVTTTTNDADGIRPLEIVTAPPSGGTLTLAEIEANQIRTVWHPTLDLPAQVIRKGMTINYEYDAAGQLIQETATDTTTHQEPYATAGLSRTTSYVWAPGGRLLEVDGPRAPTTVGGALQDDIVQYSYDAMGNLLTATNALGHVVTYAAHDANGRPGEITDPNGVKAQFVYDLLGRITTTTVKHPSDAALDAVTSFEYDNEGRVVGLTPPQTSKVTFQYDLGGKLLSSSNEDGERIDYGYDAMGNVSSTLIKRADGSTASSLTRTFDTLGRLIGQTIGADRTKRWEYDALGNPLKITSPRGMETVLGFDHLNRLISTIAPDQGNSTSRYDGPFQTSFTDPKSVATQFVHNGFGEVIQEISPDRGTSIFYYDNAGQMTASIDGRGQRIDYSYDILGRLTTKTPVGLGLETVNYVWDAPGITGSVSVGRLSSVEDATGITRFAYDHRGNMVTKQQKIGTTNYVSLRYAYDLANRIVRITYPSGRQVRYGRDARGRVQNVATRAGTSIPNWITVASGMRYEAHGALRSAVFGNGLRLVINWGDDGRLRARRLYRGLDNLSLSHLVYHYDLDGNFTRIADAVEPAATANYRYDNADRLTRVTTASATPQRVDYGYDANGNRLWTRRRMLPDDAVLASADNYIYTNDTNRLARINYVASGTLTGTRFYSYDARGNMLGENRGSGMAITAGYDGHGRLVSYARQAEGSLAHSYNGLDDRVATVTTLGGTSAIQRFLFDGAGRILAEYGASSSDINGEFIWLLPDASPVDGSGGHAPLAVAMPDGAGGTKLDWVHGNHLGVPVVTSDASGNAIAPATSYNAPGFPGQTRTFADLYYNRYRDYDSSTGRYIQADPIGLTGGTNPYLYANANPLRFTDPTGKCPTCWAVAAAAAVIGEAISQGVGYLAGVIERGQNGQGQTAAQTQAGFGDAVLEGATEAAYDLADEAAIVAATGGAGYAAPKLFNAGSWLVNRAFGRRGLGDGCVEVAAERATARQTLFHYTNEAGASGITGSNSLNPSLWRVGTKDVRYGNGQYLSDIAPGTMTPAQLSRAFLGRPFHGSRFTHYVEIDATGLGAVQGRAGVYVVPNEVPLDLTGRLLNSGKVSGQ